MTVAVDNPRELDELLVSQERVLRVASALNFMSRETLRWQVSSGRWQQPCRGIVVAHSGPLTEEQRLWTALLAAGQGAVLAGLTAARLDGFRGFTDGGATDRPVYLVVPAGRRPRCKPPGVPVVVHYSTALGAADVHPSRQPPRTRIARSLVDAAAWMATDRGAQAILAAGVQQHLASVGELSRVVAANRRLHRRKLITQTLGDIAGGAQALSELDFTRLVIRGYRLPEPDRQRRRKDSQGRNRYLDVVWEKEKIIVEIDGAQHMDPLQYWDDMGRDIDLQLNGYRVLRFPAWLVRHDPGFVAAKIRAALKIV
jgi:very-short-patch-repair endonuclease